MPAWRSPGKGVWQAPGDHPPAPIRAWLLLPPCFGIQATTPSARSWPDPALPCALPPAPPAAGAKGSPGPPGPALSWETEALHGCRGNPSTKGPCPSKGPLSPSLGIAPAPAAWNVEVEGMSPSTLCGQDGLREEQEFHPLVSRLAAVRGRLQSPAWGCRLVAGLKGSWEMPHRRWGWQGGQRPRGHSTAAAEPCRCAQSRHRQRRQGGPRWHSHVPRHSHNSRIQEPVGHWCRPHMGSAAAWGSPGAWSQGCLWHCHSSKAAHSSVGRRAGGLRAGWALSVSTEPLGMAAPSPRARASSGRLPPSTAAQSPSPRVPAGPAGQKATEAGMTIRTPTDASTRLGVLTPWGHLQDSLGTLAAPTVRQPV